MIVKYYMDCMKWLSDETIHTKKYEDPSASHEEHRELIELKKHEPWIIV